VITLSKILEVEEKAKIEAIRLQDENKTVEIAELEAAARKMTSELIMAKALKLIAAKAETEKLRVAKEALEQDISDESIQLKAKFKAEAFTLARQWSDSEVAVSRLEEEKSTLQK
jgi:hypothetical protein